MSDELATELAALQARETDGPIDPNNIGDGDGSTKTQLRQTQQQADVQQPAPASTDTPPADQNAKPPLAPLTPEQIIERDRQSRAALKESRQRERAMERRLAEEAAERERMTQNWQTLMTRMAAQQPQQATQPAAPPAPPAYDPTMVEQQPLQALKALAERVRSYEQQEQERIQSEQQAEYRRRQEAAQQQQQAYQIQTLANDLQSAEQEFAIDNPDYDDAAKHFVQSRIAYTKAMFPAAPLAQVQAAVRHEILQASQMAFLNGQDPAELIYQAAKAAGFGAAPNAFQAPAAQPAAPAAQQQPPAAAQQSDPLAMLRAGQESAQSLGGGGAAANTGDGMSLTDILKLDGAAFDAASAKFLRNMGARH